MKEIHLSGGAIALVDDEDYDTLNQWRWHLNNSGYATRRKHPKRGVYEKVYMHRLITGAQKGQEVDHVNGEKLDNRRSNLRLCNRGQNTCNRPKKQGFSHSQYKGVSPSGDRWAATITAAGAAHALGCYATEAEAAAVYNEAAKRLHGEFAVLNDVLAVDVNPLLRPKRAAPRHRASDPNPTILCACGCGETLAQFDGSGRPRKYVSGHNGKGKSWTPNRRLAYERQLP